jgi:2,5-diketo-D-gluconate reductase B
MEYVEAGEARIPKIGLGTWQNEGQACVDAVRTALELGYRHVDTAQMYENEAAVGRAIEAADVSRDDLFLTTKVWRSNLRHDDVIGSVEASLDELGVEYVDLLLIHWPHPRVPLDETLSAMAELREAGAVRHLGVSNFTADQLRDAIRVSDSPIVADQVLYHPYTDQPELRSVCRQHEVALTAYSPLARGAVLDDDTLADIGDRYGKSPAQVALRWLVQQDGVVAIPKASSRDHLEANLAVFDFELSAAEVERVDALTPGLRTRLYNLSPAIMRRNPF